MHGESRTSFQWLTILSLILGLLISVFSLAQQDDSATARVLSVDGPITPATSDYLIRGINDAGDAGATLIILQLDTPGGLLSATRDIVKQILASPVPVVTYVSPSGARAASAGTYILLASHVAAMAPATHLGSATPVQMGGMPGSPSESEPGDSQDKPEKDNEGASAMEKKVLEDAVAYIRELASRHGRNADWAEQAVREAVNLGAKEAVEENVADVVAPDLPTLLDTIDGRTVQMASGKRELSTSHLTINRVQPDWRTRLLSVITDPNVAYFLMILGFYGIIFELANPGALYPGVIGAICLILALFAFQVLSVNYAGLTLVLLGLAFIVAEAFVPSFGILGLGGIVGFVIGSIILMDGQHRSVSLPVIGGTAAVASGFLLWIVTRFLTLRRRPVVSGAEQMSGEEAVVLDHFEPDTNGLYRGHVQLHAERWKATSKHPLKPGDHVNVKAIHGLEIEISD